MLSRLPALLLLLLVHTTASLTHPGTVAARASPARRRGRALVATASIPPRRESAEPEVEFEQLLADGRRVGVGVEEEIATNGVSQRNGLEVRLVLA